MGKSPSISGSRDRSIAGDGRLAPDKTRKSFRHHGPVSLATILRIRGYTRRYELERLKDDRNKQQKSFGPAYQIALLRADLMAFIASRDEFDIPTYIEKFGGDLDDPVIARAVTAVDKLLKAKKYRYRMISPKAAGAMVCLTRDEKIRLHLRSMHAYDETDGARKLRNRANKRDHEREQKSKKRIMEGRLPRWLYEKQSASMKKPWLKAGLSRSSWYRRGKHRTWDRSVE